jgi:hypothetical protein
MGLPLNQDQFGISPEGHKAVQGWVLRGAGRRRFSRALAETVSQHAEPSPYPLYRGIPDESSPEQERYESTRHLSFTPHEHMARQYAGERGRVVSVPAGTRAFNVNKVMSPDRVGKVEYDSEWIVPPKRSQ